MNSSSERASRGTVLRGEAATRAVQAALAELAAMPSGGHVHHGARVVEQDGDDLFADDGYRDGYEAGLAEARRHEASHIDELRLAVAAMARAADALTAVQSDALARIAAAAPAVAYELTELLVGRELELSENPGIDAVTRALALAPESVPVTLRLNPADAALVGDLGDLAGGRPLTIVADIQVGRGDCVADADSARIDATLAGALDRVRRALLS
jgi:flagellar assembly protein FliH